MKLTTLLPTLSVIQQPGPFREGVAALGVQVRDLRGAAKSVASSAIPHVDDVRRYHLKPYTV